MVAVLGSWAIPRRMLLLSTAATVAMVVPLVGGYLVGGFAAAVALGMGYLASARSAFTLRPMHALGLAVPAAMAGAAATGLRGQPLAAACFVALTCLLIAPANAISDALLAGVPTTAALLVSVPGTFDPGPVALWMLLGGAIVVAIGRWLAPSPVTPAGVPSAQAWRHAIAMAIAVALVIYLINILNWPHGYWIAVTVTMVLRPFRDQTLRKSWQRVVGTLAGALLAMALASLLPLWAIAVALVVCQALNLAYLLRGDYARQVIFLTPAILLLGSAGHPEAIVWERAVYTAAGAVLAAAFALLLAWYEGSRAKDSA